MVWCDLDEAVRPPKLGQCVVVGNMGERRLQGVSQRRGILRRDDLPVIARVVPIPTAVRVFGEGGAARSPPVSLREPQELAGILNWARAGCLEWQRCAAHRLQAS